MNHFDERKDQILGQLQREAGAAARRRRAVRAAGSAGSLALVAVGAWVLWPVGPTPAPSQVADAPEAHIVDPRVDLAAYTISDEELIAALDEAGEPYTLMWVGGEPRLIESPEADAPI